MLRSEQDWNQSLSQKPTLLLPCIVFHSGVQDLKDDPILELTKLLRHLRREIDPGRLGCIKKHSEGSFHRINQNKTEDPFTPELHKLLDTNIRTADNLLKTLTGKGLPLSKYQYYDGQSV